MGTTVPCVVPTLFCVLGGPDAGILSQVGWPRRVEAARQVSRRLRRVLLRPVVMTIGLQTCQAKKIVMSQATVTVGRQHDTRFMVKLFLVGMGGPDD